MEAQWEAVAAIDDVPEGGTLPIRFHGEPVCLYRVDGVVYATHDICTHADASLSEGFLVDRYAIECPLHQGLFDIRDGKAIGVPCTIDLRTYAVKLDAGVVYLRDRAG